MQLDDGGWNCWTESGSVRSSFHSTTCVLEGMLAYERATGGTAAVAAARRRGEEYLLERGLFRRLSTGEVADPRQPDGTWLLENTHPGQVHFQLEEGDGRPSRWNTLRAMRVLRRHDQSPA